MNQQLGLTALPKARKQARKQDYRPEIWGFIGIAGGDQIFDVSGPVLPIVVSKLLMFLYL